MTSTRQFKDTIEQYLKKFASESPKFKERFELRTKNIDDCITYILNTVKASGCNGFADEEVFGMALHYYDEDVINIGTKVNSSNVVVNHNTGETDHYKAYKINKKESKWLADTINKDGKKKLSEKPLDYWKNVPHDTFNKERVEEINFMVEYYTKEEKKTKTTNKRATNSKAKKTQQKAKAKNNDVVENLFGKLPEDPKPNMFPMDKKEDNKPEFIQGSLF